MQNPVGFATARASLHCKLTGIARLACLRNAPAGAVTVPELKAIPHNSRLTAQAPLRGCGTASALPKCSIMSGCGTRIVHRGQKPLALCDRCPCFGSLHPPLAALTFAASSIICAFGLASAAPRSPYRHLELCGIATNQTRFEKIEKCPLRLGFGRNGRGRRRRCAAAVQGTAGCDIIEETGR